MTTKHTPATPLTDSLLPRLLQEAKEFDGYISSAHYTSTLVEHARNLERQRYLLIEALGSLADETFAAESGLDNPAHRHEHNIRLGDAHASARALLRELGEER